jgi:outer membrane lipoprotein-sorting protein
MYKGFIVVAALCMLPVVFGADVAASGTMTPEEVLRLAEKARETTKDLSADIVVEQTQNNQTSSLKGKVAQKGDTKMKLELSGTTATPGGAMPVNMLTIMNEKLLWQVLLADDGTPERVMKMDMSVMEEMTGRKPGAGMDAMSMLEELQKKYDLEYKGAEDLKGEKVHVLEGTAKDAPEEGAPAGMQQSTPHTILMYLSVEGGYPVKVVHKEKDGTTSMNVEYTNVKYNTGIEDSAFDYTPPEGVQVMDVTEMVKQMMERMKESAEQGEGEEGEE